MKRYIINGRSMEPTLLDGQTCILLEREENYYEGQIICFERYGQKVIHRLIVKTRILNGNILVEKGDNYPIASLIQNEDIIGRCINVEENKSKIYRKRRIIFMFIFSTLCKKMAELLRRIRVYKYAQLFDYFSNFVIPTCVLDESNMKEKIRELKKGYIVYCKFSRYEELKKIYHKKDSAM